MIYLSGNYPDFAGAAQAFLAIALHVYIRFTQCHQYSLVRSNGQHQPRVTQFNFEGVFPGRIQRLQGRNEVLNMECARRPVLVADSSA